MTEQEIDALYPCQPPCDSFGVCDNCCEKKTFKAGYQAAMQENEKLKKEVKLLESKIIELSKWNGYGECVGADMVDELNDLLKELKKLRGKK